VVGPTVCFLLSQPLESDIWRIRAVCLRDLTAASWWIERWRITPQGIHANRDCAGSEGSSVFLGRPPTAICASWLRSISPINTFSNNRSSSTPIRLHSAIMTQDERRLLRTR
jgi:hypothetical protein